MTFQLGGPSCRLFEAPAMELPAISENAQMIACDASQQTTDPEQLRWLMLKADIESLCRTYMEENQIVLRARGIELALLYNAAMFKGMFEAQGIEIIDAALQRLIKRTETLTKQRMEQALNIMEVENGTSRKS